MCARTKFRGAFLNNPSLRILLPFSEWLPIQLIWKFLNLLKTAFWRAFEHDAFATAKASAYSCILSFFPALLVLGAVLATSQRFEIFVGEISRVLGRMLPAGSATAVQYLRSQDDRPVTFLLTTSLLTVWTGSGVIISWMAGFRQAYQIPQVWGLVKERLIACSLVISAGIPLTIATILVAFGTQIENRATVYIGHQLGLWILFLWVGLRWLLAILTSIAVIALIYHNAVPRTQRWHSVLPGASLATGMWLGATVLFGWYVNHHADYSRIYGSLGVGIALLVWMYLISLIVLTGAEFNALLFPRSVARPAVRIEISPRRTAA